ncbi:MAG: VWA domain-containing protein [Flavobacteriales bacterium]|nr:VWA domain-containing protein [Flavobacteriales bacterium]
MSQWEFVHPEWFWALLLIPLIIIWEWRQFLRGSAALMHTGIQAHSSSDVLGILRRVIPILRIAAFALITVALARPRTSETGKKTSSTEGIDIVLALDVSSSMDAMDFKPNRLEASKEVAAQFVADRPSDRFAVVVYAGESFTQSPLTTDHRIVRNSLADVQFGRIDDGTAIGMGLATAVNRLKESVAESKVIILMSDGVNNSGFIDPLTAAEIAQEYGVRVYTIGVGSMGMAPKPTTDVFGRKRVVQVEVEIDEERMKEIADLTGGKYFRATDNEKLSAIYEEIDQLEKTQLEELTYYEYEEKYAVLVLIAAALVLIDFLLRKTIFKSAF